MYDPQQSDGFDLMQRPADLTIVVDVGARYGMHPSWRDFDGELLYLAVEPDAEEAARLRSTMKNGPHRRIEVLATSELAER